VVFSDRGRAITAFYSTFLAYSTIFDELKVNPLINILYFDWIWAGRGIKPNEYYAVNTILAASLIAYWLIVLECWLKSVSTGDVPNSLIL